MNSASSATVERAFAMPRRVKTSAVVTSTLLTIVRTEMTLVSFQSVM